MTAATWSAADVERDTERLIERIRSSVIGDDTLLDGPFGPRRMVYADYTASGRSLEFIERFIHDEVLPLYANTHTEASASGIQTTRLREEARELIHRSVGRSSDDVVVFCGSGATGAVDKLVQVLGLGVAGGLASSPAPPGLVRPTSGRSSSSARTSTTRTSCHGGNPSPTSSRSSRRTRGSSTCVSSTRSSGGPPRAGSRSAASPPPRTRSHFDPRSGLWHHRSGVSRLRVTLEGLRFSPGGGTPRAVRATAPESVLAGYLDDARRIVRELEAAPPGEPLPEPELTSEFERIRWFPLPAEAIGEL